MAKELGPQGLQIVCFPCNQFDDKSRGSNAEIKSFVQDKFDFQGEGVHMMDKIDVSGPNTPVWAYLKPAPGDVFWNFAAKFLVDKEGERRREERLRRASQGQARGDAVRRNPRARISTTSSKVKKPKRGVAVPRRGRFGARSSLDTAFPAVRPGDVAARFPHDLAADKGREPGASEIRNRRTKPSGDARGTRVWFLEEKSTFRFVLLFARGLALSLLLRLPRLLLLPLCVNLFPVRKLRLLVALDAPQHESGDADRTTDAHRGAPQRRHVRRDERRFSPFVVCIKARGGAAGLSSFASPAFDTTASRARLRRARGGRERRARRTRLSSWPA